MRAAVEQHEPERQQYEEREEHIQQRDAAEHDRETVDRHETRGHGRERHGVGERLGHDVEQQHERRAEDGRGDPPPERRVRTEQGHSGADQELSERRMNDEAADPREDVGLAGLEPVIGIFGPRRCVAEVPLAPGVLHVERLVEDELVR